jgi:hypothetical protein
MDGILSGTKREVIMCNKIPYETKTEARKSAKIIKNDIKRHKHDKPSKPKGTLAPYLCEHCGQWHLTAAAKKLNLKRRKGRWNRMQREEEREKWRLSC